MKADNQQSADMTSLYDAESLKAFNQMYSTQTGYGAHFENYQAQFQFMAQHFAPYANPMSNSSFSPSSTSSTSSTSSQQHPTKKKPVPVPEDQKDEVYKERRRRNNEAARKSREAKRKVDVDNGQRVQKLEEENIYLRGIIQKLSYDICMMKQAHSAQAHGIVDPQTIPFPTY
uniref:BZIP domain-containing protein n=1 Tax=Caenorhabditis tropicalis TaxID=1561998 RepID=A0A1I7T1P6_9PELO